MRADTVDQTIGRSLAEILDPDFCGLVAKGLVSADETMYRGKAVGRNS